jgi:hypothetical protein
VVRALQAVPLCDGLVSATADWDQAPSPLWRKRIARHTRDCGQCGTYYDGLIPAERLLAGLPLVPAAAAAGGGWLAHTGLRHQGPTHRGLRGSHSRQVLRGAARSRHGRILVKTAGSLQPKVLAATLAVTCAAGGGALAVAHQHTARPEALASHPSPASHAAPPSPVTAVQQAAFVTASTSMLEHLSYVQRYAWFALPSSATDGTVGLFGSGAVATTVGRAFEAADVAR